MTKSTDYIKERASIYKPMKEQYLKDIVVMDKYIETINKFIKQHDVSNIDPMTDLGIDVWYHISKMRDEIADMGIFAEITLYKYKSLLRDEIQDKFDVIEKGKEMFVNMFGDIDKLKDKLDWCGRLFSTIQGETKKLVGDRRSSEFMNVG